MQDYVLKVKNILEARDISLKELSAGISVPYRTLQDNMSTNKGFSVETLRKIATYLRVSVDELLSDDVDAADVTVCEPNADLMIGERQRHILEIISRCPEAGAIVEMMEDMDPDTQKDLLRSAEKEKLMLDLLKERSGKGAA